MRLCSRNVQPAGERLRERVKITVKSGRPAQAPRTPADTAMVADPETAPGRGARPRPLQPTEADSHWWVECVDPFGRCRAMNVVVQRDRVVVVAPPGQAAVLSADQTRLLGSALDRAATRATG
jgi:hypothetical protein